MEKENTTSKSVAKYLEERTEENSKELNSENKSIRQPYLKETDSPREPVVTEVKDHEDNENWTISEPIIPEENSETKVTDESHELFKDLNVENEGDGNESDEDTEMTSETINNDEHSVFEPHLTAKNDSETTFDINDASGENKQTTKQGQVVKSFACYFCSKLFKSNAQLKKHIRCHTLEKPYKCMICKKAFSISGNLNCHMLIHSGKTPYTCNICNKGFTNSSSLKGHLRKHTGERPYKCKVCDKTFAHLSNMKTHSNTHTRSAVHPCDQCNKTFNHSNSLKRHKLKHTIGDMEISDCNVDVEVMVEVGENPFQCKSCNKAFSSARSLTGHLRTHVDDKPYNCTHCDMTFAYSFNLKTHQNTHTREASYQCDLCSKKFNHSNSLKRHCKKKHPSDDM